MTVLILNPPSPMAFQTRDTLARGINIIKMSHIVLSQNQAGANLLSTAQQLY